MKARSWQRRGMLAAIALLALITGHPAGDAPWRVPAAWAQSDARWNALYDRLIRLEHEMKAMKRSHERRIRQLERQLRAARGGGNAAPPARRTLPPAPSAPRAPGRQGAIGGNPAPSIGNAPRVGTATPQARFAPLPPLQQPELSIEIEDDAGPREQVLGRLRAEDLPTASTGQPAAPAPARRPAPSPPTARGSGPIPLPGAVTGAVGAAPAMPGTPNAPTTPASGNLVPGQVAVAPLPPVGGSGTATAPATTPPAMPSAPAASLQPASIPPALARLSADALLQKARQNFLARRYDKAEQAFRVWLSRFPNDPRAAEARYELGETLYIQGRFRDAGRLFVEAYRAAPDGKIAPRALLRLGQALKRLGKRAEACKAWETLLRNHPDSRAARLQAPRELRRNKCKG